MKKTNIAYWIFTGLFAAFMLFTSLPDLIRSKEANDFMTQLGYPAYITPFLGVMKTLGVIALFIPGFPRVREWAYAGLAFDLLGAIYSIICVGTPFVMMLPMLIPVVLLIGSYYFYHRRKRVIEMEAAVA